GDVEPDPPRRLGRAQGGAEARRDAARDAALDDPPREHAHAETCRRHDPVSRAGLLPRGRECGRPGRLRRRASARPARARQRAQQALGTVSTGTLPANEVRTMFDRIAPVYDVMNRVMTAGLDLRWRRLTAQAVVRPGDRVLDACCGTGDLAIAALRAGGVVTGLDFAPRMLERARRGRPQQADAGRRLRGGRLPALCGRNRRAAHGSDRMSALATIRETPGLDLYLDELEEQLEATVAAHEGVVSAASREALSAGG